MHVPCSSLIFSFGMLNFFDALSRASSSVRPLTQNSPSLGYRGVNTEYEKNNSFSPLHFLCVFYFIFNSNLVRGLPITMLVLYTKDMIYILSGSYPQLVTIDHSSHIFRTPIVYPLGLSVCQLFDNHVFKYFLPCHNPKWSAHS